MSETLQINGHRIGAFWVRFIVQVIITCSLVIGAYFKLDSRTEKLEERVVGNTEDIRAMNGHGTTMSHETDAKQQQYIEYLDKRVSDIERAQKELIPKVDKIDTNLLWVMSRMKDGGSVK